MLSSKSSRNRLNSDSNAEPIRHRRTRSGCFTCRSRRVKCDETHPTCERCRKGGRDCVYPDVAPPRIGRGSSSTNTKTVIPEVDSQSDEYEDEMNTERTHAKVGKERPVENDAVLSGHDYIDRDINDMATNTSRGSETPSLIHDKGASPTPSTEGSTGYPVHQTRISARLVEHTTSSPSSMNDLKSDWSYLQPDLQIYLTHFYKNITFLHYSLKFDPGDFLRTVFLDAALRNDELLYGVVGFSAFQMTLQNPEGKLEDFLPYYNKAVSLLLRSLKRGESPRVGTLLAILQLATIEEYLGDWINLIGHQKAAFEILTKLYTPQTIMETESTRIILGWYVRFDVFAGLMGGFGTVLSRDWFFYAEKFLREQTIKDSLNLSWKIEHKISQTRLLAMDMAILFAKMGKGEISQDSFATENEHLAQRIQAWKTEMDPALQDRKYLIFDFPGARALDPDDIVNPYLPATIYSGPLWIVNLCIMDWYSLDLMHKYQTALVMGVTPGPDIQEIAFASCQILEAVEFWPGSPPGTLLACQASLGISCLFLPRDEKHAMWGRRKLAAVESSGYIFPFTFRSKMSDLFRDPRCLRWWLPNDEDYPQIVRSIRNFVEERNSRPRDEPTEDLHNMKSIFASLNLADDKPNSSIEIDRNWS